MTTPQENAVSADLSDSMEISKDLIKMAQIQTIADAVELFAYLRNNPCDNLDKLRIEDMINRLTTMATSL